MGLVGKLCVYWMAEIISSFGRSSLRNLSGPLFLVGSSVRPEGLDEKRNLRNRGNYGKMKQSAF